MVKAIPNTVGIALTFRHGKREHTTMNFSELLALLQSGEDVPETIYDDLANAYSLLEGESASNITALAAKEDELAKAQTLITELKAMNFELLMSKPSASDDNDDNNDDTDDDGSEVITIDDLFKTN